MTETFQRLWEGEKPSEDILNLTDQLMNEVDFSIGMTKIIQG